MVTIIPTILTKSVWEAKKKLREIEKYCKEVHIDIADNEFVSNKTFPASTIPLLKTKSKKIVHAMCFCPEKHVKQWKNCKIIFHAEAVADVKKTAKKLALTGIKPAIAITPNSPASIAIPALPYVSEVLVMTVYPGFGGQPLIKETLKKIKEIKTLKNIKVSVDGGINKTTAKLAVKAGADILYIGSALWKEAFGLRLKEIRSLLRK
ncbi:hypothetical protein HY486_02470 [Candidatus Woesearchaeota archaeon]|nr:hypothetical protein [Candidatus Woesearchaeota archaeon]